MKSFTSLLCVLFFFFIYNPEVSRANSKDELSIGIAVGNGTMSNVKGMHGAVDGNPGTNVKGLVLDDDSLNTIYSINIDYNKYLKDNLYLNTGIAFARHYTVDTSITFDGGSNSTFPDIHFRGIALELGPSYRFDNFLNFTPHMGLNASTFLGFQSDTNFGTVSGNYGEGGAETFVKCFGLTPNIGFFFNSGFLKGYGISLENLILECDNEHNRSMTEGYEADFNIMQYRLEYRVSF